MPSPPSDASQVPGEALWSSDEATCGIAKLTPEERPVLVAHLQQIVADTEALILEAEEKGQPDTAEHLSSAVQSLKSGLGHVGHLEVPSRQAAIAEQEELRRRAAEAEIIHVRAEAHDPALLRPTERGDVNELQRVALIEHFAKGGENDFDPAWWTYARKTMTEAVAQRTGKRYVIDVPDDVVLDPAVIDLWEDEQITFSMCEDNCGGKLARIELEKSRLDHERLAKFRAVDVASEDRRAVAGRAAFIEEKRLRIGPRQRQSSQIPTGRHFGRISLICRGPRARSSRAGRRVVSRTPGGGSAGDDSGGGDPEPGETPRPVALATRRRTRPSHNGLLVAGGRIR